MGQIEDNRIKLNTIVGVYNELNTIKQQVELIYRLVYNNNIKFNQILQNMQNWSTAEVGTIEYELYQIVSGIFLESLLPYIITMQTKSQEFLDSIDAVNQQSNNELLDINTDSI